ncbi:uncharacterized protein LOC110687886 [Chenopodium quinoa]|uniref:uncharacterized protein LOC110687886 n=1 Tax=Chenopodium quinoa TaxID=63459 RepID=UPI000B77A454|nr:uncharacterized protein LOC110687886 [Chenopodium quinoa]
MKETPLHLAVQQYRQIIHLPIKERKALGSAYFGIIKLMIEKESCIACWQDAEGRTPLHRAASITSTYTLQIIRFIINKCPKSVKVRDNSSKTILHHLKTVPSYKEAKDLLGVPELFGLINHQDEQGNTPLHLATMNLNHFLVRALLDFSAEQSIKNYDGIPAGALIQEQSEVIMEKKQMTMEVCEATERADVIFLKERLYQFGMIFLFPRDSKRRNILHKLMQLNSGMTMLHIDFFDFIEQVLESFPELICQVDLNGDTPLIPLSKILLTL